jgi:hypothetical protein
MRCADSTIEWAAGSVPSHGVSVGRLEFSGSNGGRDPGMRGRAGLRHASVHCRDQPFRPTSTRADATGPRQLYRPAARGGFPCSPQPNYLSERNVFDLAQPTSASAATTLKAWIQARTTSQPVAGNRVGESRRRSVWMYMDIGGTLAPEVRKRITKEVCTPIPAMVRRQKDVTSLLTPTNRHRTGPHRSQIDNRLALM